MEEISHGFVLKTVPYGDSGLVVKILTDTLGPASFMVQGAKRKGKSSKAGLFAPMSHVSVAFVRRENRDLYTARRVAMHWYLCRWQLPPRLPRRAWAEHRYRS